MKILVLANNDVGLYKFRKELLAELHKDHEIVLALPYGDFVKCFIASGYRYIDTEFERRGRNPFKDLALLRTYLHIIRTESPNVVLTYTIKPNIYGGIVARLLGKNYATNITGLGTAFEEPGFVRDCVICLYRIALKRAKVVFFENESNQEAFLQNHLIQKHQACLLSGAGVNLDEYTLQEYPDNPIFQFLFMGRIMKEKGVEELFSVMRRLNRDGLACNLDVLGGFEEQYEGLIKQYQTDGWLSYYGYQPDVRPYIQRCDCFVLPSWHEGMANTNLECAASGRPIITSDIPGCREAVIDRVSGFVCEAKNEESLYQAMKRMLEVPKKDRIQMGIAGREHMESRFNRRIIVEETLNHL